MLLYTVHLIYKIYSVLTPMFAMLLCVVHSIIIGQGMRCLFSTPPLKNVSFYLKIRKTRACIMPKCYLLINEEKMYLSVFSDRLVS